MEEGNSGPGGPRRRGMENNNKMDGKWMKIIYRKNLYSEIIKPLVQVQGRGHGMENNYKIDRK